MTDRELLKLAAKAAGHRVTWGEKYRVGDDEVDCTDLPYVISDSPDESPFYWDPLTDDGDALRLAVKIGLEVSCDGADRITVGWPDRLHPASKLSENCIFYSHITEPKGADAAAATRRAIVMAAAEIGKAKQ